MPESTLTFEENEPIDIGNHGEHDWTFEEGEPVEDAGESTLVYEAGVGLGGGGSLYASTDTELLVLNYEDFSIARRYTPSFDPHGAGGDGNVFWVHNQGGTTIYNINPVDFSVRDSWTPSGLQSEATFTEIGGKENVIWVADAGNDLFLRVDPQTKSVVDEFALSSATASGGDEVFAYSGDFSTNTVRQHDPADLSVLQSTSVSGPSSGGGGENHVYIGSGPSSGANTIVELDPADLSVVRSVSIDYGPLKGLGGI